MRKITFEINLNKELGLIPKQIHEKIEYIKLIELLKINFDKCIIVGIFEMEFRNNYIFEDITLPKDIESLNLLKIEGKKYTCFIKFKYKDEKIKKNLKKFDLDIIWTGFELNKENILELSLMGENELLIRFLDNLKKYGEINIKSYHKAEFENHNILSSLTNKQREILLVAKKSGYYDYPRAINGIQLSEKIGISKATTIEHLRKAEKRLISQILLGY